MAIASWWGLDKNGTKLNGKFTLQLTVSMQFPPQQQFKWMACTPSRQGVEFRFSQISPSRREKKKTIKTIIREWFENAKQSIFIGIEMRNFQVFFVFRFDLNVLDRIPSKFVCYLLFVVRFRLSFNREI